MNPLRSTALAVLLLLLLACLVLVSRRDWPEPAPVQAPRPPLSAPTGREASATPSIGIHLYAEDAKGPAAAALAAAGAAWSRTWFGWDDVEPVRTDPPTYHWQETDQTLLGLVEAGFEPIFLFGGNARWASDTFCGPVYPQAEADFQRFLRDLVARYSVPPYNVRLWEMYNEPDSLFGAQGYCFGGRGDQYATSLRLAYEAIKSVDARALVLFGGISYDFFLDEGGPFDPAFLDEALAAGAGPYFDVLAFHYYPAFAERWQAFGPGVAGKAAYLRAELARYDLDKPLALTEIGRPTRGPAGDPGAYSQALTAAFVAQGLALARTAGISPVIWFTAVDKPGEPYHYGLLSALYQPQASYFAYRAALAALQGSGYAGPFPVQGQGQAYMFEQEDWRVLVAWADRGTIQVAAPAAALWSIDVRGAARAISDGGSGDLDRVQNGLIHLATDGEPMLFWMARQPIPR